MLALEAWTPRRRCPDCSSRSKGSIRAASRRRPSRCATALEARGPRVRLLSFPDYTTPIGAEIGRALHGERDYAPDVMQLLYVANRYERKPRARSAGSAAATIVVCDRYLASSIAYGEAQGLDAAWLTDIQRLPAAARPDDPARHRARDGRRAQGGGPRPVRARPGAAHARARELPPPGRRTAGGCGSTASAARRTWPPTSSRRSARGWQ